MASGGLGTRPLTPVSRLEHYRLDTLAATRLPQDVRRRLRRERSVERSVEPL
ncbi:MAG TPA: hypothetical protein V6D30_02855 [Leptolyngbyaceae cyanobacterium]|jgi:hypothetical protein